MPAENVRGKSALAGKASAETQKAREWNASLISHRPVRLEYCREPDETEKHCQRRIAVATGVFLGLLLALSAVALCLLWMKIGGTLPF